MAKECQCELCREACEFKPGWFAPGEAEVVANFLGMSLKDLFDSYLMVDWYEWNPNIFLLSPAVVGGSPGGEFSADPKGRCVFFENGLCKIHRVKPFECSNSMCSDDEATAIANHEAVAMMWNNQKDQNQIKKLLGRNPKSLTW